MAITKIVYVDGVTVIRAAQLNAWQDEMIRLDDVKYEKPADGIPKSDLAAALQTLLDKAQDVEEAAERGDFDGEDGVSPTITVEEITGGHRVTITDATGTQSFDVMDGEGGGGGGTPGRDGYSPVVTITEITGGHRVTITSKANPEGQTFDVLDGDDGKDGAAGGPGPAGADGVSPVIAVTDIPGGHRVTITDATGTRSFDVMDGTDGEQGAPGATPDLQIGTVATGEPGSAAEATITGTPTAPQLNLTLPRGQQGPSVPLSDATPLMDGTASPGTGTSAARADHVHPHDTSKQARITASGILKGNGSGGVSAAVAGTDYLTPATNYSPVVTKNSNYTISASDSGKTIIIGSSTSGDITITIDQTVLGSLPFGAEIAFVKDNSPSSVARLKIVGIGFGNAGVWTSQNANGVYAVIPERYGMITLKKMYNSNSAMILFGNVEVVS